MAIVSRGILTVHHYHHPYTTTTTCTSLPQPLHHSHHPYTTTTTLTPLPPPVHHYHNPYITTTNNPVTAQQLLLNAGAKVNALDSEGNAPLHIRSYGVTSEPSDLDTIVELLEHTARLSIRNRKVSH